MEGNRQYEFGCPLERWCATEISTDGRNMDTTKRGKHTRGMLLM